MAATKPTATAAPAAEAATAQASIDVRTSPDQYRHWKLSFENGVAYLTMDVNEDAGLRPGYKLKLNSYDLGVDIELADAVQRLRFEHPEIGAVVIRSQRDRIFCSGANINMLGLSSHDHKVNFCKFTNETRLAIEDASRHSDQSYICSINGIAAGGGYELALACEQIMLADDGASAVSLPELPLLAVLPGTGGLTRLVDKRLVRRDHADFFCTTAEGVRGKRARDWRLVDRLVPPSRLVDETRKVAEEIASRSSRPKSAKGIALPPVERTIEGDTIRYAHLSVEIDRDRRAARLRFAGPSSAPPPDIHAAGAAFWPLALAREFDDAMMHLRLNETEIGTWVLHSQGDPALVEAYDALLARQADDWLVREIVLYWKRTLKRLDVSSRSLIALVEPGSCFVGTLLELVLAADRSYMLDGTFEGSNLPAATLRLSAMNFAPYPMGNGLTRLATRFLAEPGRVDELKDEIGEALDAPAAERAGLVTFTPDDIDWEDEVRLAVEERAGFSPDGLTGMEANLRFAGPETMETKIFARLSAWQNWIFQRPNATGPEGALKLYGTGRQSKYDRKRA
jgi:benzoyl-CoA-dihydrodiol lyase